jgi:hypothetical protein
VRTSTPAKTLVTVGLTLVIAGIAHAATDETARRLGGIKGDEATYVGIAASLAYDADLRFDAADYRRFREWYGSGPEGIFLKRDAEGHLRFGKAYAHGVLAAPFVRAFGLAGLVAFNVVCLVLIVAAGTWWLAPGSRLAPAAAFAFLFLVASVAPVYGVWLTSDLLNFTLVFLAFVSGTTRDARPVPGFRLGVALVLLALATYSKPIILPLAGPLVLANAGWRSRRALLLSGVFGALVVALFGVNALISGDANYQGGDRKSFYGRFPFDEQGSTFETTGIAMATETVATPVGTEGRARTLLPNLAYFMVGRHFGLLPFGWTWLVVLGAWALFERSKQPWHWALAGALAAIALVTLVWMPYTWSGAGGPIGNRYFLSVAGAVFVLMPPVRSWRPVAVASIGLVFLLPSYRSPALVARQPWLATRSPVFSMLPLEMTGASDFPVILDQRRGRIPQGRDPQVSVALLDERAFPGRGGWIGVAEAQAADLLVRSPARLKGSVVGVRTERACDVQVSSDRDTVRVTLGDADRRDIELGLSQVFSHNAFASVIHVDASGCPAGVEVALQGRPES